MAPISSQIIDGIHFFSGAWPLADDLPTIVFIHGSGGSAALWHQQVNAFDGIANTVALDLPGHGRSTSPGCTLVADYTQAVAAFIRRLDTPRPIPCGLSIGGAIVLQLLLDAPETTVAGILVNTGARLRVMPAIFELIGTDYSAFVELVKTMGAAEATDPACLAQLLADTLECPPSVTAGDFKACDEFDVMGRLSEIRKPVLVLSADDDRLTPPKYADFLEAGIAGAQSARIAAAGHLSPLEQPNAVNTAIRDFLMVTHPRRPV